MTTDDAKIIAQTLNSAKPDYKDPTYKLWLHTVSTFLIFAARVNPVIDIERLETVCENGEIQ